MTPGGPGQAGGRGAARGDASRRSRRRRGYRTLRHAGQGGREPPALGLVRGIIDEVVIEGGGRWPVVLAGQGAGANWT